MEFRDDFLYTVGGGHTQRKGQGYIKNSPGYFHTSTYRRIASAFRLHSFCCRKPQPGNSAKGCLILSSLEVLYAIRVAVVLSLFQRVTPSSAAGSLTRLVTSEPSTTSSTPLHQMQHLVYTWFKKIGVPRQPRMPSNALYHTWY